MRCRCPGCLFFLALQRIAGASAVPTEPNLTAPSSESESDAVSAIENEIPTYRAISPQAVFSLILGILAVFSFSHWVFLTCAAAAIVLGIVADRRILRYSDVLTGRGIAQAGIALGLVFGLSAITIAVVQDWILVREASRFARSYEGVLAKGTFEDAVWYAQSPLYRVQKTPQEVVTELKKSRPASGMFDLEQAALTKLRERLGEGADIHFLEIEQRGKENMNVFAAALFEVHPQGSKPLPAGEQYAMVLMKGMPKNRRWEWWVDQVAYPYKPDSYKPEVKPVDDGHGHGPGGH
jgi:hypothetical protein